MGPPTVSEVGSPKIKVSMGQPGSRRKENPSPPHLSQLLEAARIPWLLPRQLPAWAFLPTSPLFRRTRDHMDPTEKSRIMPPSRGLQLNHSCRVPAIVCLTLLELLSQCATNCWGRGVELKTIDLDSPSVLEAGGLTSRCPQGPSL